MRRVVTAATRQLVQDAASSSSSVLSDLITTATPSATTALDGAGDNSTDSTNPNYANSRGGSDQTYYIYVFLGVMLSVGVGSVAVYCYHQRRVRRFVEHDNMNNNMQRHSLVDSFIEAGEIEWQCTVCYHENHPAKRECLMCGTPQVISQQVVASPARGSRPPTSFVMTSEGENSLLAARNRSFHVRRLNERNLNQRQRGARRRNLWQREKTADGQFRWVRIDDCRPSRLSLMGSDYRPSSLAPTSPPSDRGTLGEMGSYIFGGNGGSRRGFNGTGLSNNVGVETELTMSAVNDGDGHYEPTIRIKMDSTSSMLDLHSPTGGGGGNGMLGGGPDFIEQPSVGYVRHVDEEGNVEWVPAEMHFHEAETIDVDEFPRASSIIDFESAAALSFRHKVRWFLQEIEKVSVPWEEGHLLLKIRRDAVLNESMHLLMLVPASDLRQRLRIEFIDEPGLDAGGLMREWVLLLCEKLFDESFGLFQPTHVENLGYWINPNSSQIHRDHLRCYQFVGRLIAKCLLEGQLLTVHFSLPLLKHILGVPISFSDLEFLDEELYRNALWLRDNDHADALCLDFTIQRIDGNDEMITDELKPGGKDIAVTDDNKDEYLNLLMKHKMFDSVKEQVSAVLEGLYDVIPRNLLAVFDYQELELLLCGVPQIDVDDWQDHSDVKFQTFDQPSKAEKKVVEWFWETVRSFSQEQRARLLQFVTGTSRVPVEGFKALLSNDGRVRRFGIQIMACGTPPAGLYPKAHTCFNRIDLPMYPTKQELETYLTLVINMEITGFSMQ
ncbi:Hect e3 ubiquitin ligase [Globisporangium polare]